MTVEVIAISSAGTVKQADDRTGDVRNLRRALERLLGTAAVVGVDRRPTHVTKDNWGERLFSAFLKEKESFGDFDLVTPHQLIPTLVINVGSLFDALSDRNDIAYLHKAIGDAVGSLAIIRQACLKLEHVVVDDILKEQRLSESDIISVSKKFSEMSDLCNDWPFFAQANPNRVADLKKIEPEIALVNFTAALGDMAKAAAIFKTRGVEQYAFAMLHMVRDLSDCMGFDFQSMLEQYLSDYISETASVES